VHVDVVDEPYKMEYKVTKIVEEDIIRVDFIWDSGLRQELI